MTTTTITQIATPTIISVANLKFPITCQVTSANIHHVRIRYTLDGTIYYTTKNETYSTTTVLVTIDKPAASISIVGANINDVVKVFSSLTEVLTLGPSPNYSTVWTRDATTGRITQETRTNQETNVSETRAYTYNGSGALISIGEWA